MGRVVIGDGRVVVRMGVEAMLASLGRYDVVGKASDGPEALAVIERERPDIALLDVEMSGMGGIDVMASAKNGLPELRVVFFSEIETPDVVMHAVRGGADGFVLKDATTAELGFALDAVANGHRYLSPRVSRIVLGRFADSDRPPSALTPRQIEILRLIAKGLTGKSIAQQLGLSPKTVEFHRAAIMNRLNVRDVAGLTRYAVSIGLVSSTER